MIISRNFWKYTAVIFAVLLILSLYYNPLQNGTIAEDDASKITSNFIKTYLLQDDSVSLKVDSVTDEGDVYRLEMHIDGQEAEGYTSKDGQYFFPAGINIESVKKAAEFDKVVEVSTEGDQVMGDEDAPVTMVEFSDFQCSYCTSFALNTMKKIKKNYVDTGLVKVVFKNLPLERLHQYAPKAAEAGECAAKQGKFWQMHDVMFGNSPELSDSDLKRYAKDIGLDSAEFDACLDSDEMKDAVKADIKEAEDAGIEGTPAFVVNGRLISGAQEYKVFQTIIEEELAKSQSIGELPEGIDPSEDMRGQIVPPEDAGGTIA